MKLILPLLGLAVLLAACTNIPTTQNITSFDECVKAGNPVMESSPRQCSADGQTFVEELNVSAENNTSATGNQTGMLGATCTDEQKAANVCTLEYAPVCGLVDNGIRCVTTPCPSVNATTFGNSCQACAGQAQTYYPGACINQTFVICSGGAKSAIDPATYAQQIGGICVDTCPGNYDAYTTQIGVQVCIQHYDAATIETWPTCDRTTDACDCVRAYETTDNQQIENATYRCVPQRYAGRMLFSGGLDQLDENGQQSTRIA